MRVNVYIHILKNNACIHHEITRTPVNYSIPGPKLNRDSVILMSTKLAKNCYILMEQEISLFCSNQSTTEAQFSPHPHIYFTRYFHLHLRFQTHLSSGFALKRPCMLQFCPSQPPLFDCPNNI
jgi:hypothetical protein